MVANLVEMCGGDDEQAPAPCKFGNIVVGHSCYCHHANPNAPRKCPIWRNYAEELTRWHPNGDFDGDNWEGGCIWFEKNEEYDWGAAAN